MEPTSNTPRIVAAGTAAVGVAALVASLIAVGHSDAAQPGPARYRSATATTGTVTRTATGTGTVQPSSTWDVSSAGALRREDASTATTAGDAGTIVESVQVAVGAKVRAGQVLVRLDRSILALRKAAAERALTDALAARDEIDEAVGTITETSGGDVAGAASVPVVAAVEKVDVPSAPAGSDVPDPQGDDGAEDQEGDDAPVRDASGDPGEPAQAAPAPARAATTTTRRSAVAAAREADAAVIEARAALAAAEVAWRNGVLRAPAAGTVAAVNVVRGSRTPSGPLVTVAARTTTVDVDLGETEIVGVDPGDVATVSIDSLDAQLTGRVAQVGDATGGGATGSIVTYPVTIAVTGSPVGLRVGMQADVTITASTTADVLVVPRTSVRTVDGEARVRVLDDERDDSPKDAVVEVGARGDGTVEILDGLQDGDLVVVPAAVTSGASSQRGPVPGLGSGRRTGQ